MSHTNPMTSYDINLSLPMLKEPSPDAKQKARLFVCSKADNADEARELMDMLGLLEESE